MSEEKEKTQVRNKIDEDLKRIVMARLEVFPFDKKISIGSIGELTKEEMIENVRTETNLGEKMIAIELNYLQGLKNGIFYEQDSTDNKA